MQAARAETGRTGKSPRQVLKDKSAHPPTLRGFALVLVGPEGRGKDLLIAAARRRFASDDHLAFPASGPYPPAQRQRRASARQPPRFPGHGAGTVVLGLVVCR